MDKIINKLEYNRLDNSVFTMYMCTHDMIFIISVQFYSNNVGKNEYGKTPRIIITVLKVEDLIWSQF